MKKFLLTSLCLTICLVTLCGCKKTTTTTTTNSVQQNQQGNGPFELKTGTLNDDALTNQVKLSNVSFTTGEGSTVFKADVTNVTASDVTIYEIDVIVKDAAGKELVTFRALVDNLAANETKTVESSMDSDLTNYATYEYVIKANKQ